MASPLSMAASLEPVVEHPMVVLLSGACHRSASMWTQRISISAVWGYSSLSIMFLEMQMSMRRRTSFSSHVVQKVARFIRALPSSMSSSATSSKASRAGLPATGSLNRGASLRSADEA